MTETKGSEKPFRFKTAKYYIVVIIAICAVAAALFSLPNRRVYFLEVRSYFVDARGLTAGAPVRLAGVDVGTVKSIRARPELRDHPAEVILALRTPYALSIPADAKVSLASAGVLGPTFVDIDVRSAFAEPVAQEGILESVPNGTPPEEQLLERITEIINAKACSSKVNEGPPQQPSIRSGAKTK